MSSYSRSFTRALPALLLFACGSTGAGLSAAQVNLAKTLANREMEIYASAQTVVDMAVEDLLRDFPKECRDLDFDADQAELPQLLRKTGESVAGLIRDIPNTASKEQVRRERLGKNGSAAEASDQNYNYLVLPGKMGLWEETRTDSKGRPIPVISDSGTFFLTSGFAGLAILFHPEYQEAVRFRLLGRQRTESNPYVIAFAQKPGEGSPTGVFETPLTLMPAHIMHQGLVWVDPRTHQILRMRIDLLAPRRDVLLDRQTTEIWFQEVRFRDSPHPFWLPREVLVTVVWNGQTYRNRHRYSDYLVFSVESRDKLEQPKIKK